MSSPHAIETYDDSCPLCQGEGVIQLGDHDEILEQVCPHVIEEHKQREKESALDNQKQN